MTNENTAEHNPNDKQNYLTLNGHNVHPDNVEKFTNENHLGKIVIQLQTGPIKDHGVNGIQIDEVIVMVRDIIASFNSRFPCRENSLVLTKLDEAKMWCDARTANRIKRDVEGQDRA